MDKTDIMVRIVRTRERKIMKLEELLGEELYKQVQEKLDAVNANEPDKLKHVRYADLSEGEYVGKGKYDSLAAEKNNLTEQIKTLNTTIATLKKDNKDNETLQTTITNLQTELSKQQKANEEISKTYALKEQLTKAGVVDADYLIYKHGGIDKFTFDKENNPIGVEDTIKPYKEDTTMAHLFKEQKKPPYTPNGGGNGGTVNPFAKETYNLTKQGELLKSNPEQAKAMAIAAGITL